MAAYQSIPAPSVIANAQQLRSETSELKTASLRQRIEALIERTFEYAFGHDEKTIRNSLRGL